MANSAAPRKKRVLFVCIGNACRSQFAEAIAKHTAFDVIEPSSAGLAALGEVPAMVEEVLAERGIPCEKQHSKSVSPLACAHAEVIVNLSGLPREQIFPRHHARTEDWVVEDPYGHPLENYREACDEIEARMAEFSARRREQQTVSHPTGAHPSARS
jgi:arsenate reductase (thioredoxin)